MRRYKEFKIYINTLRKCRKKLDWESLNGYVVSMPPKDESLLYELSNTGITGVKFNLELADPQNFSEICPEKAKFGYDKIVQRLSKAVEIFGRNNVYTNFVLGLERDTDVIVERAKVLAEKGIGVVPHIFHKDKWAKIESSIKLSRNEILEVYSKLDKINKKHDLRPWPNLESLICVLGPKLLV